MPNKKKDSSEELTNQMDLLSGESKPEPGSLDIRHALNSALSKAIKESGKSRYQIAAGMSEYLGYIEVTKSMLDNWTSDSHGDHRFPLEVYPAFKHSVQSAEPLKLIGRKSLCQVLESTEAIYAKPAMLEKKQAEIESQKIQLKSRLS
jgi:hypothetical protein